MKELNIKHIESSEIKAADVPSLLDKAGIVFNRIDTVNWTEYPYCPEAGFRLAYTDNAILLNYKVKEDSIRAIAPNDNGNVWEDSCVEFFSIPADDGIYYNIECNCAGTLLVGAGNCRNGRKHAPLELLRNADRWSSLGRNPFDEKHGVHEWELALVIPFTTFFMHEISSLKGKSLKSNFYKCGDGLQVPHFLSWNPIETETPDFHRPDYFGTLHFE